MLRSNVASDYRSLIITAGDRGQASDEGSMSSRRDLLPLTNRRGHDGDEGGCLCAQTGGTQ